MAATAFVTSVRGANAQRKPIFEPMTASYSYQAYGFGIHSPIRIASLPPRSPNGALIDFHFDRGPRPEWVCRVTQSPGRLLSHRPDEPARQHGDANCYSLSYSEGPQFVIDLDARKIWGTVHPPLSDDDLLTYFVGPVMGFLLRRLHITALHASAVEIAGQAVAFSGHMGYGKSTTAAALALRGQPVLAEDIVAIREEATAFYALPGYPRVCLWPESVTTLLGAPDALPPLIPGWEKCYLQLDGIRAHFAARELAVGLIYLFAPRSAESSAPRVEEIGPREALLELVQNTYMNWLLDREQRAIEFDTLARLVKHVPIRRLIPHSDPQRLDALCDLILGDAENVLAANQAPLRSVSG